MGYNVFFPADNISQSSTRLAMKADPEGSERFVLVGKGFTYNDRGILTGGTITSMEYYIGTKLYTKITIPNLSAATLFKQVLSNADLLSQMFQDWNIADLNPIPVVTTTTQTTFQLADGTSLRFSGSFNVQDPDAGTVKSIAHLDIDNSVIDITTGLSMPAKVVWASLMPSNAIFDAISAGANTVRGASDTQWQYLDGGLGDDTMIGSATGLKDFADYATAKAAVRVNLTTGVSTGGAGNDKLIYIENATGSRFSDTLTGDNKDNWLQGFAGNDKITGFGGADTLYGDEGNDTLDGGAGVDLVFAGAGSDTVIGGTGSDQLYGDAGNDIIRGGLGNDILTGGDGYDTFVFDTAPSTNNVDSLFDFNARYDTIALDHNIFTGLGALGTLAAGAYWTNETGQAHDADDRIIVKSFAGFISVYYDADGTGATAAVQVASFTTGVTGTLTNADFKII